jgi:CubicO group peptidase (beta-lactamase class C family)
MFIDSPKLTNQAAMLIMKTGGLEMAVARQETSQEVKDAAYALGGMWAELPTEMLDRQGPYKNLHTVAAAAIAEAITPRDFDRFLDYLIADSIVRAYILTRP